MRFAALLMLTALVCTATTHAQEKPMPRLFEMRTYTAAEGKLDALNARFREHTNRLFVKHGMTLIYILAYPSREGRERSWDAFRKDPEWNSAREASEKAGKLVEKVESKFLTPTDYSPIK
jgi:hypothetical protein